MSARRRAILVLVVTSLVGSAVVAAVSLGQPSSPSQTRGVRSTTCPSADARGGDPIPAAVRSTLTSMGTIIHGRDTRGTRANGALVLGRAIDAPGVDGRRYSRVAIAACGRQVASRSVVVFMTLGNAPDANHSFFGVYLSRQAGVWRPWLLLNLITNQKSKI